MERLLVVEVGSVLTFFLGFFWKEWVSGKKKKIKERERNEKEPVLRVSH